jgi:hypothetical protein
MTVDKDAGPDYAAAIKDVEDHPEAYSASRPTGRFDRKSDLVPFGFQKVLDAAHDTRMTLYSGDPTKWVSLQYPTDDPMEELHTLVGDMNTRAATLMLQGDKAQAAQYREAILAMGIHLFNERVSKSEFNAGIDFMGDGAHFLAQSAEADGNSARANKLSDFEKSVEQLRDQRKPLMAMTSVMASDEPGNVVYLALHAKDRLWRVEALLQLGRIRYNVGPDATHADQINAQKVAASIAAEPGVDRVVGAAARYAADLTSDQYFSQKR